MSFEEDLTKKFATLQRASVVMEITITMGQPKLFAEAARVAQNSLTEIAQSVLEYLETKLGERNGSEEGNEGDKRNNQTGKIGNDNTH